jgi:hypothetical protein
MRLRLLLTVLLAGAIVTSSTAAHAEQAPAPAPAPETPGYWYGWQVLAVDAACLGVAAMVGDSNDELAGNIAGLGLFLGSAVVHLGHGRPGAAVGSVGLRGGGVFMGMIVGVAMSDCDHSEDGGMCSFGPAVLGGGIGFLTGVAIDAAFLAREEGTPAATRDPALGFAVTPRPGGMTLSLGGTF